MLALLTCCIAIPPEKILVSNPASVSDPACKVTILREKTLFGSAATHYLSLNKVIIAEIDSGEYTSLQIPEGSHSIGVTWRVGDKAASVGSVDVMKWYAHKKEIKFECKSPEMHHFLVIIKPLSLSENDRIEFKKVEKLDGDFAIEKHKYVKPGPR